MSVWLHYLLLRDWRDQYHPWPTAMAAQAVAITLSLTVYWYTAKALGNAFSSNLASFHGDYFSFVVVGEIVLHLPIALLSLPNRVLQTSAQNGTFEAMVSQGMAPSITLVLLALTSLSSSVLAVGMELAIAFFCFNLSLPLACLPWFVLGQFCLLPGVLGLGLLAAAMTVRFGRGSGLIDSVEFAVHVFSGVYFPLTVLPPTLHRALEGLSPFARVLDWSRHCLLVSAETTPSLLALAPLALGSLALLATGLLAVERSFSWVRHQGLPLLCRPC